MKAEAIAAPSLEYLVEPAYVVRRDGEILAANSAGRRLFATDPVGTSLFAHSPDPRAAIETDLRRAAATTAPSIGALTLATTSGPTRHRMHAARLERESDALVVRLLPIDSDQFALLSGKVRELDRQLRQRLQEKVALEEALRLNRTLLDELQHRVKNNIQIMMTLIRMSARGRDSGEVWEVVERARLRLQAMASTQEAVYRSGEHGTVRSGAFFRDLLASISESAGLAGALELEIVDVELDSEHAHCLALIVNELVTNAAKHGLRGGRGAIRVVLAERDAEIELTVSDDGPGMPEGAGTRHSGLHLVRSLCRQIGGRLDIASEGGTTCRVRFGSLREMRR